MLIIILSASVYMNFIDFGKINYQLGLFPSTFLTNSTYSNEPQHKVQSECTYANNFTVYMDSFEKVSRMYFEQTYQHFLLKSHQCNPSPGGGHCLFNHDNASSDAILYYVPVFHGAQFKRAFNDQVVIAFILEPEKKSIPLSKKYDIKVSYRRDATVPVPYFCDKNRILNISEMGQPDVPVGREKLIASFIKHCRGSVEWRTNYLRELMEYIHVDQWGTCLKNTPGDFWKTRKTDYEQTKLDFLKQNPYKFLVTFENYVEPDYISEKIYDAYLSRTIPIYYGHRTVFDLVPANTSLIYANDYSPKELAKLIEQIANNDTLYSQYFANWDLNKMRKLHQQYCVEHFICRICREVWNMLYKRKCAMN